MTVGGDIRFFTPADDVQGAFTPSVESGIAADRYAGGWRSIWQDKHPAAIKSLYHPGAAIEGAKRRDP